MEQDLKKVIQGFNEGIQEVMACNEKVLVSSAYGKFDKQPPEKIKQSGISGRFAVDIEKEELAKQEALQKLVKTKEKISLAETVRQQFENGIMSDTPNSKNYNPIRHYRNHLTQEMVSARLYPTILDTLRVSGGMDVHKAIKRMILGMSPFENLRLAFNDGNKVNIESPDFIWRVRERVWVREGYYYQDTYIIDTGVVSSETGKPIYIQFVVIVDRKTEETGSVYEVISEVYNIKEKDDVTNYSVYADIHPYAKRIRVK